LPLREQLHAAFVRLAEDGAQSERLVVGEIEGMDQPHDEVRPGTVLSRCRRCSLHGRPESKQPERKPEPRRCDPQG
jgi:hypothetical protein